VTKRLKFSACFIIRDETALRAYAEKIATERGELDYFLAMLAQDKGPEKVDGETATPGMIEMGYIFEAGGNYYQHITGNDEACGFEWNGTTGEQVEAK
jgi:hypothetical protein